MNTGMGSKKKVGYRSPQKRQFKYMKELEGRVKKLKYR